MIISSPFCWKTSGPSNHVDATWHTTLSHTLLLIKCTHSWQRHFPVVPVVPPSRTMCPVTPQKLLRNSLKNKTRPQGVDRNFKLPGCQSDRDMLEQVRSREAPPPNIQTQQTSWCQTQQDTPTGIMTRVFLAVQGEPAYYCVVAELVYFPISWPRCRNQNPLSDLCDTFCPCLHLPVSTIKTRDRQMLYNEWQTLG